MRAMMPQPLHSSQGQAPRACGSGMQAHAGRDFDTLFRDLRACLAVDASYRCVCAWSGRLPAGAAPLTRGAAVAAAERTAAAAR